MCQQDDEHQAQGAQKSVLQKGAAFSLVFLISGPFPFNTRGQWAALKPSGNFLDPFCGGHFDLAGHARIICDGFYSIAAHPGLNVEIALLIDARDLPQFGNRLAGDEIGQRDQPIWRAYFQRIKRRQNAVSFRQTHADIDFFI